MNNGRTRMVNATKQVPWYDESVIIIEEAIHNEKDDRSYHWLWGNC